VECLEIRVRAIAGAAEGIVSEPPAGLRSHSFAASCPELGLSCQADSEEEALNRIQSLIAFQLTCNEMETMGRADTRSLPRTRAPLVVLYLPYRTQVQ